MIKSEITKKFYVDFLNKNNDLPNKLNEKIGGYLKYIKLPWHFVYHPLHCVGICSDNGRKGLTRLTEINAYLQGYFNSYYESNYISLKSLSEEFELSRNKLQLFSSDIQFSFATKEHFYISRNGDICCDIFGIIGYEPKNSENYESEIRNEINDIYLTYGNVRHSNDFLKNKLELVICKGEKPNQYLVGSLNTFYPIPLISLQGIQPALHLKSSEKIKLIGVKVTYIYIHSTERRYMANNRCYFGLKNMSFYSENRLVSPTNFPGSKMKKFSEIKKEGNIGPNNLIMM